MQTFNVPQFIDMEAKIIGPISARQFIIIIVAGGLVYLNYKLLSAIYFFAATGFVGIIAGALAFGKVNGQTMHYFLLNMIQTLKRPNLRIWKRTIEIVRHEREDTGAEPMMISLKEPLTSSRLAQISLTVDTGGRYSEEEEQPPQPAPAPTQPQQENNPLNILPPTSTQTVNTINTPPNEPQR